MFYIVTSIKHEIISLGAFSMCSQWNRFFDVPQPMKSRVFDSWFGSLRSCRPRFIVSLGRPTLVGILIFTAKKPRFLLWLTSCKVPLQWNNDWNREIIGMHDCFVSNALFFDPSVKVKGSALAGRHVTVIRLIKECNNVRCKMAVVTFCSSI